jgi:hydrogenase large subunit
MEVQVQDGQVVDAWSAGTMFRGIELVLNGRDPREAWLMTQRICGVCTTVHALASVRAVEDALGITVPDNARLMRNLIEGAQFVHDHVIHFYHLHALDWVDVVSALDASPEATSALARSRSEWPNSSSVYFAQVKARLEQFVGSGQLGLFANGFWGHPEYRLSPEANLLAVAHYLEALGFQRRYIKFQATLGGKNPHPQTYLVGGMALPVAADGSAALTPERIAGLRQLTDEALAFINQVYLPDLVMVASSYPDWFGCGAGYGSFLAYGDFPDDISGAEEALWLPRGIARGVADVPPTIESLDQGRISEYVAHSWYDYSDGDRVGRHPQVGETLPHYTGPTPPYEHLTTDKYSWLKAPRYDGLAMEVGPLARVMVALGQGHARIGALVAEMAGQLGISGRDLISTLGRVAARAIETVAIAERMHHWLDELEANITAGDWAIHNGALWEPSTWPTEAMGWGATEAPRGGLGHWVQIANGRISHYQAVVPTTWNGSPRDATGQRGVWEEALIGVPVADPARPLEVLRVVHSFDPCMACAVHLVDAAKRELTRIELQTF